MIELIFTIDYEIYGNGAGSLRDHVYEPAEKLKAIFLRRDARFVFFVEAAELERIEEQQSDDCIGAVRQQVREAHRQGFEIALHLHPQWYNGRYVNRTWQLDQSEYNLCVLPAPRIAEIVERSIVYLRGMVGDPAFRPLSFRAGNWLFQPTKNAATVLSAAGIRIDSSVFKGGLQRLHRLDYRPALKNGHFWRFHHNINEHDPAGALTEIPTHTRMVPFWTMLTAKRVGLQKRAPTSTNNGSSTSRKMTRLLDYARLRYPLKLDFCRMTSGELIDAINREIREDRRSPSTYRPLVAIGHTKDLYDLRAVDEFLAFLNREKIPVTTFREVHARIEQRA